MIVFGYARLSPGERDDLREQKAAIRRFAKKKRLKIHRMLIDEPVDNRRGEADLSELTTRSGMHSILDPESIRPEVLIIDRPDRLIHPQSGPAKEEIQRQGTLIVVVGSKIRIPRERSVKNTGLTVTERLSRGRVEAAKAGRHQSGPSPYGYRRDKNRRLVIDEEESEVIRLIFRLYLSLRSMRLTIQELTARGKTTRRGKKWTRAGLSWILKNETYLGKVHYGEVRAKGLHSPIIYPITFNKANHILRANNKRAGRQRSEGK